MLLGLGRDGHAFACQDRRDPFGGPAAFGGIVDRGERLQRDRLDRIVRERAAEIMPVAAHGERGRADRAAEIEGKDLGSRVAPELQRHQRQQHALAGAGRSDHEGVPDVADVQREPERRCALGLGEEERRAIEMLVALGPGPDRRERDHVGEVEGRDRRLAHIGVDVTRQAAEPSLDRVDAFGDAGEIAALNDLLDEAKLLVGDAGILVPDRDGGGHVGFADQVGAELLERRVGIHRLVVGVGSRAAPRPRWSSPP